jgi:hypothetical protein
MRENLQSAMEREWEMEIRIENKLRVVVLAKKKPTVK